MLLLSLLALILTKAADVLTTVRGIRRAGGSVAWERNPLARWAMRRFGLGGGITMVLLLWSGIVTLCYATAWAGPAWYQMATAVGGFGIAWVQADVARMNATGRHSWLTARLLRGFGKLRRP